VLLGKNGFVRFRRLLLEAVAGTLAPDNIGNSPFTSSTIMLSTTASYLDGTSAVRSLN
jgi:hypothetical protein